MTSREMILKRLQTQRSSIPLPPKWRTRNHYPSLVEQFSRAFTTAKGEVILADSLEDGLTGLGRLFEELKASKIVINSEVDYSAIDFAKRFPNQTWFMVGSSDEELRKFASSADIGITGVDAALAETGSIVISSGLGKGRVVSLLPPVNIALVPTSRLTTDIFTWLDTHQNSWPANTVLVSGPSKTADIEQTLAVGVHGPKRVIVILYHD